MATKKKTLIITPKKKPTLIFTKKPAPPRRSGRPKYA